jgi:hypothetical protein
VLGVSEADMAQSALPHVLDIISPGGGDTSRKQAASASQQSLTAQNGLATVSGTRQYAKPGYPLHERIKQ